MERKILAKRIAELSGEVGRLNHVLLAMGTTDIEKYPDNYELISMDAALRSEKIACRLRHLIYASTDFRKSDYLNLASSELGIDIQHENGIVTITLPCLLPKRKQRQSSEFLLDPLYFALNSYTKSNSMQRFRHCVVCFTHIYDKELPGRRIRDYDNFEIKQILDVVSPFIMVNDGGLLCDAYHTTELGNEDCTVLSIMDKNSFSDWLDRRNQSMDSVTDFGD